MTTTRTTFGLAAALTLGLLASNSPAEEKEHHHPSHIHHALHELKEARHELRNSKHDHGGHKGKALEAINDTIHILEKIVAHEHHKLHASTVKSHPNEHHKHASHLHHTLHEVKEARHELRETKHDFGGLKHTALKELDIAVHQLELVVKHHKK